MTSHSTNKSREVYVVQGKYETGTCERLSSQAPDNPPEGRHPPYTCRKRNVSPAALNSAANQSKA
jgi:hypothetical protein